MNLSAPYETLVERLATLDRRIEMLQTRLRLAAKDSEDQSQHAELSLPALLASRAAYAKLRDGTEPDVLGGARVDSHGGQGNPVRHAAAHDWSPGEFNAMSLLLRVSDLCASGDRPIEECLGAVLDAAIGLTGAEKGNVQVLERASGSLRIAVHKGFDPPFLEFFDVVSVEDDAACSHAMKRVERVVVRDVCSSPIFAGFPSLEAVLDAGVRAVTSVPLVVRGGEVVGVLSTHFAVPHAPDERTLSLLEMLGRLAADYLHRIRAQQDLDIAAHHLRQTFENAAIGLTRCSRDLKYVAVNQTYASIAGVPVESIVGRHIADVLGTEAFDRIRPRIEKVLAGERVEYEDELPYSAGGPKWIHVVYAPWREGEEVVGWLASISDISSRRRAEDELRLADRRKDEFLATLGHELRNPLGSIRNGVHLLRSTSTSDPTPVVDVIDRQTTQIVRLVDELMDVSRLNRGAVELQRETVDLRHVLRAAVETVGPALHASGARLDLDCPPEPVHVRGDALRLNQVFANLLDNAAKYTEPGGTIALAMRRASGECVVCVRDTGIGIPADMLARVFELFAQEPTSGRVQRGLGVGLALVKRLVELHGGRVVARSDGRGLGSEFEVRLPLSDPGAPPMSDASA